MFSLYVSHELINRSNRPKPTTVFHVNRSWHKYYLATSALGDSYGPPAVTNGNLGNNKIDTSKLVSTICIKSRRKLAHGLDDHLIIIMKNGLTVRFYVLTYIKCIRTCHWYNKTSRVHEYLFPHGHYHVNLTRHVIQSWLGRWRSILVIDNTNN